MCMEKGGPPLKRVPCFCMTCPKALNVKRGGSPIKRVIIDLSYDDLHTCLRERGGFYAHSTQSLARQNEMVLHPNEKSEFSNCSMQKEQ